MYFNLVLNTISIDNQKNIEIESIQIQGARVNPNGQTIVTRFNPPINYSREKKTLNTFANYLQNLPLKSNEAEVKLYDGRIKKNYGVYDAVVNFELGRKNLHQCADAVMRLKAEFLWEQKRYNEIHFNFTNGFQVDYSEWMKGRRIIVNGNKTYWSNRNAPSNSYTDFWKYMEIIFSYAGTLSLSKELASKNIKDLKIGDVFIQGGSPGHAVIVVDLAINDKGEKMFLLAQSYMPAQEIQILKNPNNQNISPWYSLGKSTILNTPEWTFSDTDLKEY